MHEPGPSGVSVSAEVQDPLAVDHVDDLVVRVAVQRRAARRDQADELGDVEAAEVLVDEQPELAVRCRGQRGPVGVADGHLRALLRLARRRHRDEVEVVGAGVVERLVVARGRGTRPVSASSACAAPPTWSVPRPAETKSSSCRSPAALLRPARGEPEHPLLEPLAAAGAVDRQARLRRAALWATLDVPRVDDVTRGSCAERLAPAVRVDELVEADGLAVAEAPDVAERHVERSAGLLRAGRVAAEDDHVVAETDDLLRRRRRSPPTTTRPAGRTRSRARSRGRGRCRRGGGPAPGARRCPRPSSPARRRGRSRANASYERADGLDAHSSTAASTSSGCSPASSTSQTLVTIPSASRR